MTTVQTLPTFQPRRSFLFVPGTGVEMFSKALAAGTDIVCVDLEDAVAPKDKEAARAETIALFHEIQADDGVERMVRINGLRTADGQRDLLAIQESPTPPPALMLTKVKSPEEVRIIAELLGHGPQADIRLNPIIETNEGLRAAHEIAQASDRIDALLFGAIDMAADLRVEPSWAGLLHARSLAVHAAAEAGIDIIDVPFLDLQDMVGLEEAARLAAELGFTGKGAIHPKQIPAINAAFSPSGKAIAYARRVVEAFESADSGLVVLDGKLLERPVLRSAYRIVSLAERMAERKTRQGVPHQV